MWPRYGAWLGSREPAIWQEIMQMAAQQGQQIVIDFGPLAEYLKQTEGFDRFLDSVGAEQFWAGLSPQKREELLRVAQREKAAETEEAR